MFHFLQALQRSMSRPQRRHQLRSRHVSCETFETRLVLSAVNAVSLIEESPVDADNTSSASVSNDVAESLAVAEFVSANIFAPQDGAVPPPQENPAFGAGAQQDSNWNPGIFPAGAFDAFWADQPRAGDGPQMDQLRRRHPPFWNSATAAATDSAFENADDAGEQPIPVEADVQPLPPVEQSHDSNSDEASLLLADGFVEIPRSGPPASSFGGLLQDSLNCDDAEGPSKLHTPFFDMSRDNEDSTTDDDDSAINAAMAFFNQQSEGGFVNADLDELQAAVGIAGSHRSANMATSLKAGLGRFNPFEESSHTTMLTAVELRHVAQSDAGQDGEHSVGADAAMASLILGAVGLRGRSLERMMETVQRLGTRLLSFFRFAR